MREAFSQCSAFSGMSLKSSKEWRPHRVELLPAVHSWTRFTVSLGRGGAVNLKQSNRKATPAPRTDIGEREWDLSSEIFCLLKGGIFKLRLFNSVWLPCLFGVEGEKFVASRFIESVPSLTESMEWDRVNSRSRTDASHTATRLQLMEQNLTWSARLRWQVSQYLGAPLHDFV